MDAPPAIQQKLGVKVWDFVYGSLLIGGVPLLSYWAVATLAYWPSNMVFRLYGERCAFDYQVAAGLVAFMAAIVAFGLAIWWRVRHRLLPIGMIALEIGVATVWPLFVIAYVALLYGPNDAWNR